jgi:hypothetical protein
MSESNLREKLAAEIATVSWQQLREHAAKDRLFIVGGEIALLDAGVALASDDRVAVEAWIESGALARPSKEQIRSFEGSGASFRFLILSPFVLADVLVP